MTTHNGILSNFIQGVSEQPRTKRFEGQNVGQVNCDSNVLQGLSRRVGSQMLNNRPLAEGAPGSANHTYDRGDGTEKYWINVNAGTIRITDLNTGLPVNVLATNTGYLNTPNPSEDLKFSTVADTTFVVNKSVQVKMSPILTENPGYKYLIYCKRVSYGSSYYVSSPSYTVPHTAPDALPPENPENPYDPESFPDPPLGTMAAVNTTSTVVVNAWETDFPSVEKTIYLRTDSVIKLLFEQLQTTLLGSGVTGYYSGDTIYLSSTYPLDINVSDTNHNEELKIVQDEIDSYDSLPARAVDGYRVKVTGTDKTEFNDYYLQYKTDSETMFGSGQWKETAGWGIPRAFDWGTMPHELRRTSAGNFTFQTVPWDRREAGDTDTNPLPSFVDSYINDVTTYQNRLVVLSRDNLIASVTSEFYNFFSNTVTASSDSDPIDASSNDNQITNLEYAIIFNGALVLFSNKSQFLHPSDLPFTTKNISLAAKSRFSNTATCKPITAGTSIYFPFQTGGSTNVRELTMESLTGNVQAQVVTEQAKKYIRGTAVRMAADTNNSFTFVLPAGNPRTLYVYQWYKAGTETKQQALHSWVFQDSIIDVAVVEGSLYLLQNGEDLSYISRIDLSNPDTYKLHFNLKMDNKYLLKPVAITAEGAYAMYLPDYYETVPGFKVCNLNDSDAAGIEPQAYERVDDVLYLIPPAGSTINSEFIIGLPYRSACEITTPSIHDQYNRVQSRRKLRLNDVRFSLIDSGYMQVRVQYKTNGEIYKEYVQTFSSDLIGASNFTLESEADLIDHLFRVAVRGDAASTGITMISDSFLPFHVTDATWAGQYNEKGRRTQ